MVTKEVNYRGIKIETRFPEISNYIKSLLFWGLYEKSEAKFILKYLPDNLPAIELGSSIGVMTSLAARKISPQRIFSVEVNPSLIPIIKHNLELNHIENCEIINAAIGSGTELYFTAGDESTVGSVSTEKSENSTPVSSLSLTNVIGLATFDRFSLISDIEGSEIEFLFRDPDSLRKCYFIIIELHECSMPDGKIVSVDDMEKRLRALGFTILDQHGPVYVANRN